MSARKLHVYFATSARLAALGNQVERVLEMQQLWERLAPPLLAQTCRVSGVRDHVLVLFANNGAIAAKARQLAPTMLEKLQKTGVEVTAIQVRVQVGLAVREPRRIKNLRLGAGARASLAGLLGRLDDGPLRQALAHMLERHAEQDDAPHHDDGGHGQRQHQGKFEDLP